MQPQINQERLAQITKLDHGKHTSIESGICAMEAAAYIAGEDWTDHPQCVCPVIAEFMRDWNDGLPDDERTALLLPLVPLTVGTRGSEALQDRRGLMVLDWLVRTHAPAWLRLAGLTDHADALSRLPEITSAYPVRPLIEQIGEARRAAFARLDAVRDTGTAAYWDGVWVTAKAVFGATAGEAATEASMDTAGVDRALTVDAIRGAARAAVLAAAMVAPEAALESTCKSLQASAVDLVHRMIEAKDPDA